MYKIISFVPYMTSSTDNNNEIKTYLIYIIVPSMFWNIALLHSPHHCSPIPCSSHHPTHPHRHHSSSTTYRIQSYPQSPPPLTTTMPFFRAIWWSLGCGIRKHWMRGGNMGELWWGAMYQSPQNILFIILFNI